MKSEGSIILFKPNDIAIFVNLNSLSLKEFHQKF